MEILGLLTIALVAGAVARALYFNAVPSDVGPSVVCGAAGVAAGYALSTLTGVGAMTSPGDLASWLTALTGACLAVAISDALRPVALPLRSLGRAGQA